MSAGDCDGKRQCVRPGRSVWSSDTERAANVARKVRSGTVGVNHYVNEPVAPFGGIRTAAWGGVKTGGPRRLQV